MIKITRLNDKDLYLNCDLIEFIEETPDVLITLTTGKKIMVKEEIDLVIKRIIEFKKSCK